MGFSVRINTALIERVNLTVRHGVAALARRTWATSQQAPRLLAHLEWWRAYYHFVRPHVSLRIALMQPRERGGRLLAQRDLQRTPAMAAGRTTRRWTERSVLSCPLPKVSEGSAIEARWGAVSCRGEMGKVPAEELGWSLTLGREGLSGPPHHKKPARKGFGEG